MQSLKIGIAAALLLPAAEAAALRCQNKLISEGDHSAELIRFCGEPVAVSSYLAQRTFFDRRGSRLLFGFPTEVLVEEWTYNFGPHRLMRVVRIENGIVKDIRELGYGFREPQGS